MTGALGDFWDHIRKNIPFSGKRIDVVQKFGIPIQTLCPEWFAGEQRNRSAEHCFRPPFGEGAPPQNVGRK